MSLNLRVRAVDGLQSAGLGGDEHAHQRVVVRVERVALGLAAHGERAHPDRRHEVGRPEHQGDQAGRGGRDRVDGHQSARVLDLRLDADAAWREAGRPLDLAEQHVQPDEGGRARSPSAGSGCGPRPARPRPPRSRPGRPTACSRRSPAPRRACRPSRLTAARRPRARAPWSSRPAQPSPRGRASPRRRRAHVPWQGTAHCSPAPTCTTVAPDTHCPPKEHTRAAVTGRCPRPARRHATARAPRALARRGAGTRSHEPVRDRYASGCCRVMGK